CSAVKRSFADSGTYLTLLASLSTAAAIARQKSTSRPAPFPCASGRPEAAGRAIGTAVEHAAIFHRLERLSGYALRGRGEDERYEYCKSLHVAVPSTPLSARAQRLFQSYPLPVLRPALPAAPLALALSVAPSCAAS